MFCEFVGISSKQLQLLERISKEWTVESKRLSHERASRRDQFRAFAAKKTEFKDLLTRHQQTRMLKFNLISSNALEEFRLLELAVAAGEFTIGEMQIPKLKSLRNKWVNRIDKDLVLLKETSSGDREKRWEVHNERVRRVQAIRRANTNDLRSDLYECLTPEQSSRLTQIQLQKLITISAIEVFNDPIVNNDLELTRDQSEQLAQLKRKIDSEKNRFLATRMKVDSYKVYFNSLSADQKNVWRKKLGPPAWLFTVNWLAEYIEADLREKNKGSEEE
ncbi:MAG: hypothetical protein AAF623_05570 [Planctomycetota bacterium]